MVLSNNDGSIVARSAEAKALGIKMGIPYFQIRQFFETMGGVWFSSNYVLYGDMSQRVMTTQEGMAPTVEVYFGTRRSDACKWMMKLDIFHRHNRNTHHLPIGADHAWY